MGPREFEMLDWIGDRLVTKKDVADHFHVSIHTIQGLFNSWINQDLIEDSGQVRRASNNYPAALFRRTDEPIELDDETSHNYEWKPLWEEMRNGEPRAVRGNVRKHRLDG